MFRRFQTQMVWKAQNNLKILDSLPKVCEPSSTVIQEGHDMKTLMLDKLLGVHKVHEVHLQKRDKLKMKDPLALKIGESSLKKHEKSERKAHSKTS